PREVALAAVEELRPVRARERTTREQAGQLGRERRRQQVAVLETAARVVDLERVVLVEMQLEMLEPLESREHVVDDVEGVFERERAVVMEGQEVEREGLSDDHREECLEPAAVDRGDGESRTADPGARVDLADGARGRAVEVEVVV